MMSSLSFLNSLFSRLQKSIPIFRSRSALQGYLAAVDQGIISVGNFLAAIVLARAIDPTEFGVYSVGFLLIHMLRAVQDGLIIQPINTFGATMPLDEFRRFVSANAVLQISLAVGSAGVAAGLGWLLILTGNDTAGPTLFGLWFVSITWQIQEFLRRVFYTRGQVQHAAINTTIANGVRLGVMFVWLRLGVLNSGVDGLDAIAWGSLAALAAGIWQTRGYWTNGALNINATLARNWRFGRWVLGGSLANWAASEIYPIIAAGMVNFAAAGAYRALQTLVAPVHVLLRALDTFFTPRAAGIVQRDGVSGLSRMLRWIYFIAGLPILGLLVVSNLFPEILLRLLYGETYVAYSGGLILMALYYGLWYAYWPLQIAFKALQITRPIFIANSAAIISMFTLGFWLIHRWGLYGAVGGQALNALIVTLVLWGSWRGVVTTDDRRQTAPISRLSES